MRARSKNLPPKATPYLAWPISAAEDEDRQGQLFEQITNRHSRSEGQHGRPRMQGKRGCFGGQIGKVGQDLSFRHAGGKIVEHIIDGDPQAPDARLATHLFGLNRDDVAIIHRFLIIAHCEKMNEAYANADRSRRVICDNHVRVLADSAE